MCFALQRHTIFGHPNFKKCSETVCFFNILTCKCAWRYSGVQFFDIRTSKTASDLRCFVHFDLHMCFALQRHAIFRHQNFKKRFGPAGFVHFDFKMCFLPKPLAIFRHLNCKKCFGPAVFCAFSLQNVLFATAARNFGVVRGPLASAPVALTSLLLDGPDTRIIVKTQHFATSLTFAADVSSIF